MTATELPPIPCPSCGDLLDTAESLFGEAVPIDGSVTICLKCGHIMVFENNQPRNPTYTEMCELVLDSRIIKVQKARGKMFK